MNISDSIGSFSNLYKKGLIKKEQFEAKIIDIVKSDVSDGITLKAVEDYLLFFKKMLSNSQMDEKLYDEISDLLLAKCKVSEKPKEPPAREIEKTHEIAKADDTANEAGVQEKKIRPEQKDAQEYYEKGRNLIFTDANMAIAYITRAANLGHAGAIKFLKARANLDETLNKSLSSNEKEKKTEEDAQAYYTKGINLVLKNNDEGIKDLARAAKMGHSGAKSYLKNNKLEGRANLLSRADLQTRKVGDVKKPPVTQQKTKIETSYYPKQSSHSDKEILFQARIARAGNKEAKIFLKANKLEARAEYLLKLWDKGKTHLIRELGETNNSAEVPSRGFFGKLVNGDYGLAKTYWLFGVLVAAIVIVVINVPMPIGWYLTIGIAAIPYNILVYIGIWAAANKYQGHKAWAVLAKIAVIAGTIWMLIQGMATFFLLSEI